MINNPQDPRSLAGQLARGTNTYMGASKSPYAGKISKPVGNALQQASLLPQYKKLSLQDVAKAHINGSRSTSIT
jgi:hypothetical protein